MKFYIVNCYKLFTKTSIVFSFVLFIKIHVKYNSKITKYNTEMNTKKWTTIYKKGSTYGSAHVSKITNCGLIFTYHLVKRVINNVHL